MPQTGEIISNEILQDSYYRVKFYVPEVCKETQPGQFVHVKIAQLRDRILRRPFSICDVDSETGLLTVVYKVVGTGTEVLSGLIPGTVCELLGPLGNPFTLPSEDEIPVIVAGGYGSAATYILAKRSPNPGVLLLGARTEKDLILTGEFKEKNFDVRMATEDGSLGQKGLVTELIDQVLDDYKEKNLCFYGCGPHGMLMAMGQRILGHKLEAELSLDHLMCCGVGACFACVIKVKADNPDGWRFARTCKEGPVFKASEVYYE